MKLNSVLLAGLISIGLLTIGANSAFAGGYFSAGNPGGQRSVLSYPLAQTPANQAWQSHNTWTNYTARSNQIQVPRVPSSGSAPQHNSVTP